MLKWDDLELLDAIAAGGTLTEGAKRLGVDQTTASRRLARMEARIGGPLFERRGGQLYPTPLLEDAMGGLRSMAEGARASLLALRSSRAELSGRVSLSCLGFHAAHVLAPAMGMLVRRHPAIRLDLRIEDRLSRFDQREADIALRLARPEDEAAVMRSLGAVVFRRYRSCDAGDGACPVVGYGEDLLHLPEMKLMAMLRPDTVPVFTANRLDVLTAAARALAGEVMLPEWIGDGDAHFIRADDSEVLAARPLYLLIQPSRRSVGAVRAVADWIVEIHDGFRT